MLERIHIKKLKHVLHGKTKEELVRTFQGFPEVLAKLDGK